MRPVHSSFSGASRKWGYIQVPWPNSLSVHNRAPSSEIGALHNPYMSNVSPGMEMGISGTTFFYRDENA